jgi:hypothetical protein
MVVVISIGVGVPSTHIIAVLFPIIVSSIDVVGGRPAHREEDVDLIIVYTCIYENSVKAYSNGFLYFFVSLLVKEERLSWSSSVLCVSKAADDAIQIINICDICSVWVEKPAWYFPIKGYIEIDICILVRLPLPREEAS